MKGKEKGRADWEARKAQSVERRFRTWKEKTMLIGKRERRCR